MGALSWGLDLANFEGVPVRLHGFEMENVSMLWSAFVAQIFRQVRVRSCCKTVCQCPMWKASGLAPPGAETPDMGISAGCTPAYVCL